MTTNWHLWNEVEIEFTNSIGNKLFSITDSTPGACNVWPPYMHFSEVPKQDVVHYDEVMEITVTVGTVYGALAGPREISGK